jgi:hypothetical protein
VLQALGKAELDAGCENLHEGRSVLTVVYSQTRLERLLDFLDRIIDPQDAA